MQSEAFLFYLLDHPFRSTHFIGFCRLIFLLFFRIASATDNRNANVNLTNSTRLEKLFTGHTSVVIYRKKQFLFWLLVYCIILRSYPSHCESSPKIHLKQKVHEGQWDIWSPPYFTLHISKWSPHLGLARASSEVLRYYPRCSADCCCCCGFTLIEADWDRHVGTIFITPAPHLYTSSQCQALFVITGNMRDCKNTSETPLLPETSDFKQPGF